MLIVVVAFQTFLFYFQIFLAAMILLFYSKKEFASRNLLPPKRNKTNSFDVISKLSLRSVVPEKYFRHEGVFSF